MSAIKRCDCGAAKWPKCGDAWYLSKFIYNGKSYAPNLTRHAREVAEPPRELKTKTEADAYAEVVRTQIRAGTFVDAKTKKRTLPPPPPTATTRMQMSAAIERFGKDVIDRDKDKEREQKTRDKNCLKKFAGFTTEQRGKIGDMAVDAVITDDLIEFLSSPAIKKLAASSWAKYRNPIGMFCAWAARKQLTSGSPLAGLAHHEKKALTRGKFAQRLAKLDPGEYEALLAAADRARVDERQRLRGLIVAGRYGALRRGEALALQWADVHFEDRSIYVAAVRKGGRKTKTPRWVPLEEPLAAELRKMQLDPTGKPWPSTAYVFGDATTGEYIKSVDTAWCSLVLRSRGIEPAWVKTKLTARCKAQLKKIDRKFKDLRRTCALHWYEVDGWDLLDVRDALGHSSVKMTEIYLNVRAKGPQEAMRAAEERRAAAAAAAQPLPAVVGGELPAPGRTVYKPSTNAKTAGGTTHRPRLVKGRSHQ